jgi:hypothetical protein
MTHDEKAAPAVSATERRREREAEALRANLRKRKDWQRARQATTGNEAPDPGSEQASPDRSDAATE